jgi:hypothetical protein
MAFGSCGAVYSVLTDSGLPVGHATPVRPVAFLPYTFPAIHLALGAPAMHNAWRARQLYEPRVAGTLYLHARSIQAARASM